jgi:hypothetical protein
VCEIKNFDALGEWGARFVLGDPDPHELDPGLLLWRLRCRVNHARLPARRVVVQFDFRGAGTGSDWLILEPLEVSVCLHDAGFDVDVLVTADVAALHRVWLGRISLADALRDESVRLDGQRSLTRVFGTWFAWSPFAETVRTARHTTGSPENTE